MEYQVPQFIEVEDHVVGPLTLKQFIYLAGGAGLCVLFYFLLPLWLAILLSLPVGGLALALAFYRINGKSFIEVIESAFNFYTGSKLFLWRHEDAPVAKQQAPAAPQRPAAVAARGGPRLTSGKLSELAWSLDIKQPGQENEQ